MDVYYNSLLATFVGNMLADFITYPLETVLNRLCLQGTRTIIDNTDSGIGVIPIITRYEGFWDCKMCILRGEGVTGFYKGFGALLLQYGIHIGILKLTKLVIDILVERRPPQTLPARSPAVLATPQQLRLSSSPIPTYSSDYPRFPNF